MPICKLCRKNEATKTGSHIFPHSLIKSAVNFEGEKNRDKEFVFNFSNMSSPSYFQGAGVLPEKIEDLKIPIDNIQLEERNPTTEDFIFCLGCEKRFSTAESYFAEKVIVQIRGNQIFGTNSKTFSIKKTDNMLFRLYIYGLFWRGSISEIYDFKMIEEEEEQLRKWLSIPVSDINNIVNFSNLPVASLYMERLDDTTNAFIYASKFSKKPYMLVIGNFVFFLYMKEKHMQGLINHFFGLGDILKYGKYFNIRESEFEFGKVFRRDREVLQENAIDFMVNENITYYCKLFSSIYFKIFSIRPTREELNQFISVYRRLGINVSDKMKISLIIDNLVRITNKTSR